MNRKERTNYEKLLRGKLLLCMQDGEYHKSLMEYNMKVAKEIRKELRRFVNGK